jgi:hypothetical protein
MSFWFDQLSLPAEIYTSLKVPATNPKDKTITPLFSYVAIHEFLLEDLSRDLSKPLISQI